MLDTFPLPSHTASRQSFGVWAATGVLAGVNETPHVPPAQVRLLHSVSLPGQLAGVAQPTHAPLPSQTRLAPQGVPGDSFGFDGTPAAQISVVQAFLSSGKS